MFGAISIPMIVVIVLVIMFLASAIRVLNEYERAVVFRLGRVRDVKGPGLIMIIPGIDKVVKVYMRTITMDIPPQDVITKDNVSIKVNAVVYFRVVDANAAVIDVENYLYATSQLAQTTLRSVCGQQELDEILSEREKINMQLQEILDRSTEPWGIKVSLVEVKQIDLPEEMKRAIPAASQNMPFHLQVYSRLSRNSLFYRPFPSNSGHSRSFTFYAISSASLHLRCLAPGFIRGS